MSESRSAASREIERQRDALLAEIAQRLSQKA
jgi:hypothetical protein